VTSSYPTHRDVAGLRIPMTLIPRIVAAFRDSYPQITEGLSDDAAVRAVLRDYVSSVLSMYEAKTASEAVQEEIRQKQASLGAIAAEAAAQAQQDVQAIPDAPIVGEDVIPADPA
jgi:hypothetical protein